VISLDNLTDAPAARKAPGNLQGQGLLKGVDAAVITRDAGKALESSATTGAALYSGMEPEATALFDR
jgi:hypothetical protein